MKKLLLSITAAVLLHAAFLSADFSSLQLFPSASPQLNPVSITLIAYAPSDPIQNPPAAGRQTADPIEDPEAALPSPEPEIPPVNEAEEPPASDPAPVLPEPEVEPVQPPPPKPEPESDSVNPIIPQQPPVTADLNPETDPDGPAETAPVWQKPKQSLKALTKVIPPKAAAIRHPPAPQSPKPEKLPPKESRSSRSTHKPRTETEATETAGPPAGKATTQPAPSLPAALEDAANAVASVNKEVPAPKIIMARPLYRRNPPPRYPRQAKRSGLEGVVMLDVRVNEAGEVEELTVFQSSGHKMLDRAAVNSVKKWLFQPGTRNGRKIETRVRVPVRFQLQ